MQEVSTNLLERAKTLNKIAEVSMVALGMVLVEIRDTEAFRPLYSDFNTYCRTELGRKKSDVSKLTQVGKFCLDAGFRAETDLKDTKYTKLYAAMNAYEGQDPTLILAAAHKNTLDELEEERRDTKHPNCAHKEIIRICANCHKRMDY